MPKSADFKSEFDRLLDADSQAWLQRIRRIATVLAIVVVSGWYVGLFNSARLLEGIPSLIAMVGEMFPPNFSDWRDWIKPLLDTLAMSVAGTALAVILSVPIAFLAANNTTPHPLVYQAARGLLLSLIHI